MLDNSMYWKQHVYENKNTRECSYVRNLYMQIFVCTCIFTGEASKARGMAYSALFNTLQHTVTHCNISMRMFIHICTCTGEASRGQGMTHSANCNTLQLTANHCNVYICE